MEYIIFPLELLKTQPYNLLQFLPKCQSVKMFDRNIFCFYVCVKINHKITDYKLYETTLLNSLLIKNLVILKNKNPVILKISKLIILKCKKLNILKMLSK